MNIDCRFFSYLNSLSQFRLWNTAALVSKMSPCGSIQRLSHRSTVYCTNCNLCRRSLQRSGWLCDACKSITNTCSLCHLVVRGLYVWCRGCSHGGHLVHIMEWFKKNEACPTGCGHICEYDWSSFIQQIYKTSHQVCRHFTVTFFRLIFLWKFLSVIHFIFRWSHLSGMIYLIQI